MGRKFLIALAMATAGGLLTPAASADTKAGIDAWAAGDYFQAVTQWQGSADSGDAEAQYWLGQAYRLGKGVVQDLAKAEELYAKAAAQGHLAAADNYGLLLFNRGEKARAIPYLRAASDRGDARAQYLLGLAYFNADAVERDWSRACALVNLARKQGLEQATAALQQIDQHISAEDRSKGLAIAAEMTGKAGPTAEPAPTASSPALAANEGKPKAAQETTQQKTAPPKTAATKSAPILATAKTAKPGRAKGQPSITNSTQGWRIQLGAFAERNNAEAMWNRVKSRPELRGHGRINATVAGITRLQVGGFPSRAAAQEACSRLKSAGFDCMAIPG